MKHWCLQQLTQPRVFSQW